MAAEQFHARAGVLIETVAARPGAVEWRVCLHDGEEARAIAFDAFSGGLFPGQSVWLNTTAAELELGTGGLHFILAPRGGGTEAGGPTEIGAHARRPAGHLMKLRYTPLQHAVMAVEEEGSPHRAAVAAVQDLGGLPVVAAELHSAAMSVVVAARACGAHRVVYVMTDGAALPLPLSRLAARLRAGGVLAGTITAGQAFGGELEAVTVASALAAARAVYDADVVVVSQGPGNAGTGTPLGFSGLAQAEHMNTAAALGGRPVAVLRLSDADERPRHRGLSHHSATVLGRMTLARAGVAVPELADGRDIALRHAIEAAGLPSRHDLRLVPANDLMASLMNHHDLLTTMGRTIEEDRDFFLAACAAARLAVDPSAGRAWPRQD
jgi:hypothetical protein